MATEHDRVLSAARGARERHVRARAVAMSPRERLDAMRDLLARSWAMLEANPAGKARFLRRNYRSRAVRPVGGGASHGT